MSWLTGLTGVFDLIRSSNIFTLINQISSKHWAKIQSPMRLCSINENPTETLATQAKVTFAPNLPAILKIIGVKSDVTLAVIAEAMFTLGR